MSKIPSFKTAAGVFVTMTCLTDCGKAPSGATAMISGPATSDISSGRRSSTPLTKEEVGAILGSAVTSVEGDLTDNVYKTAVVGLEVTIGLERENDAQLAMSGARKATGMLGGTPKEVPNLGEEAFFGAMSVLYVRRRDMVITITLPNLQLAVGVAAYDKMAEAKPGSSLQLQALKEPQQDERRDPLMAGFKQSDGMQGTGAVSNASSKREGPSYETRARAIGVALATKVLAKL